MAHYQKPNTKFVVIYIQYLIPFSIYVLFIFKDSQSPKFIQT